MRPTHNPQAPEMADESMVRNLAAQAEAIWPQERPILERLGLSGAIAALDVGCGTGEFVRRFAERFPEAQILGVDLHEPHLARAREACRHLGRRVEFRTGDAFELDLPDASRDLVVCRHLLQAVPEPERVLGEMRRVTRPGGWLHVVGEDYGMLHFDPVGLDTDRFFREGPMTFAERTGSDLRVGRKLYAAFRRADLRDVAVEYAVLDPLRVPRPTLATILEAWGEGYAASIASYSELSLEQVREAFATMVAALRNEQGYGVWFVPIVRGRVPTGSEASPGF